MNTHVVLHGLNETVFSYFPSKAEALAFAKKEVRETGRGIRLMPGVPGEWDYANQIHVVPEKFGPFLSSTTLRVVHEVGVYNKWRVDGVRLVDEWGRQVWACVPENTSGGANPGYGFIEFFSTPDFRYRMVRDEEGQEWGVLRLVREAQKRGDTTLSAASAAAVLKEWKRIAEARGEKPGY